LDFETVTIVFFVFLSFYSKYFQENDDELEKSDEFGGLPEKNDTPECDPPEIDDNPDNNDQQDYNSDAENPDWQRY
jgi:hypothetical protein